MAWYFVGWDGSGRCYWVGWDGSGRFYWVGWGEQVKELKAFVDQEFQDVQAEAEALLEGWGAHVWQQAMQFHQVGVVQCSAVQCSSVPLCLPTKNVWNRFKFFPHYSIIFCTYIPG